MQFILNLKCSILLYSRVAIIQDRVYNAINKGLQQSDSSHCRQQMTPNDLMRIQIQLQTQIQIQLQTQIQIQFQNQIQI